MLSEVPLKTLANRQSPPAILIFDSGVGGLSIARAVRSQHPGCAIAYASDNAAFPYGTKPEAELIERVDHTLHRLQQVTKADIIVVACNTASTVALPRIRERFDIPVIGVVPAIKPAAQLSQTKVIGLLATPGTVERDYTNSLIQEFAADCRFIKVGSSELVTLAEDKLRGKPIDHARLTDIVAPFVAHASLDTIVLACTHFPLVQPELVRALPRIANWVDSGEAIARRVGYWLGELGLEPGKEPTPGYCLFTADTEDIRQLEPYLSQQELDRVEFVRLH